MTDIQTWLASQGLAKYADAFVAQDVSVDLLADLSDDDLRELGVRIFPNPVHDGLLNITGLDGRILAVEVYEIGGRKLAERSGGAGSSWSMQLSGSGTYIVVIRTAERNFVERVVAL